SFPVKKLNGDEVQLLGLVNFIYCADVGMVQSGGRLRFTFKAPQRLRVVGQRLREKLKRDVASQAQVLGFVNNAHSAMPERLDYAIMRDGVAFQPGCPETQLVSGKGFCDHNNCWRIENSVGS